jgi:hypothetical protein
MINAEIFLAHRRLQASAMSVPSLQTSNGSGDLCRDLRLAVERGWLIEPALSHSRFASAKGSAVGPPSCDLEQVALWSREHPRCSWYVETGRTSRLLVLSVDRELGGPSLRDLCEDDWDWCQTLQFQDDFTRFFAFIYRGQRLRFLGKRLDGIRALARELALIPPSWFVGGSALLYVNPHARMLEVPYWLLHPGDDPASGLAATAPPLVPPREACVP